MSDHARTYSAEVIRSLGLDPQTAHAIPPTRGRTNGSWLLKVSKTLESEAIFQHKALLSYLTCTYSCHVASKLPPRWLKMATWAQLGPTWLHLGLILAPKRPPRGPRKPQLHHKTYHFMWEGRYFCIIPCCVQYVSFREPPGPRTYGLNTVVAGKLYKSQVLLL